MRRALVALAAVFLAAHLPLLPPTLEDVDSINFALGVRDFDVASHQPHPPGYPVFIAAGKASTALLRTLGVPAAEPRALSLLSTVAGAALVFLLWAFYRALDGDEHSALWATVVAVASPLFWFTALRPLSDVAGLAIAVAAQALVASAALREPRTRTLVAGAFLSGLAIGVRSQMFVLTLPLLACVLVMPGLRVRLAQRAAALGAVVLGAAAWGVPLLVASGGAEAYATALGTQAGEDFAGVVMLWNVPTPRVAADALLHTYLWPWGSLAAGVAVIAAAATGALHGLWRAPRVVLVLAVAYGPYALFHLVFQEFVTVRYALPLVVPVARLVVMAFGLFGRTGTAVASAALALVSLAITVPATLSYGRAGSPAFRALAQVPGLAAREPAGSGIEIGLHGSMRRAVEWEAPSLPARPLVARHGHEWLALVNLWRGARDRDVIFVANPRRTDLALFEPGARQIVARERWSFSEPPFVGGVRPGNTDLYLMRAPAWMLDRGWALTAEVAGVTARDRLGPHVEPSIAWARARDEASLLTIGGRHLGAAGDPAARVTVTVAGAAAAAFDVGPGAFFQLVPLPPSSLRSTGDPYVPIAVRAAAAVNSGGAAPPVALEQFDVQPEGVPMAGLRDGFHEPEYNQRLGRSWRWMGPHAVAWVRPIGRDVRLTLAGESPLRYFDRPSTVRVLVGGREVARFAPASDFEQSAILPADALAAAQGRVEIESDQFFVPGDRDGSPDRRQLALRLYEVTVR